MSKRKKTMTKDGMTPSPSNPTPSSTPQLTVPPFRVIIDSCEKQGEMLEFPSAVEIVRKDLRPVNGHGIGGDYSVEGLEHYVAIERKALPDLIATLWGHTVLADGSKQPNLWRFTWELTHMSALHLRYVAIEGSRDALQVRIERRARELARHGLKQRIDFARTMSLISSLQAETGVMFLFFSSKEEMTGCIYADLYHAFRRYYGLSRSKIGSYEPPKRIAATTSVEVPPTRSNGEDGGEDGNDATENITEDTADNDVAPPFP